MTKYLASFTFDADRVARWCSLTADTNPLHTDPQFAATTVFKMPIVHGHLVASWVLDAAQAALGKELLNGAGAAIRFVAPVSVGSTVHLWWDEGPRVLKVGESLDEDVLVEVRLERFDSSESEAGI